MRLSVPRGGRISRAERGWCSWPPSLRYFSTSKLRDLCARAFTARSRLLRSDLRRLTGLQRMSSGWRAGRWTRRGKLWRQRFRFSQKADKKAAAGHVSTRTHQRAKNLLGLLVLLIVTFVRRYQRRVSIHIGYPTPRRILTSAPRRPPSSLPPSSSISSTTPSPRSPRAPPSTCSSASPSSPFSAGSPPLRGDPRR